MSTVMVELHAARAKLRIEIEHADETQRNLEIQQASLNVERKSLQGLLLYGRNVRGVLGLENYLILEYSQTCALYISAM